MNTEGNKGVVRGVEVVIHRWRVSGRENACKEAAVAGGKLGATAAVTGTGVVSCGARPCPTKICRLHMQTPKFLFAQMPAGKIIPITFVHSDALIVGKT